MSENAKTLLFWVSQSHVSVADDDADKAYCANCARAWAAVIISQGVSTAD